MNDTNLIKISGEILQMNEKDYLYLEGMLILPGFARKFDTGKDKVIYCEWFLFISLKKKYITFCL